MLAVLAAPLASLAQTKSGKTHRIGVLFPSTEKAAAINNEAFTLGLRERGFVEGRNVVVERRVTAGPSTTYPRSPRSWFGSKSM